MAELFRARVAPTREKRCGALAAFHGTLAALAREAEAPVPRLRTFVHDHPSDLQAALALLSGVAGLGIVVHGPAGCAAALRGARGPWASTGLDQRDSILGGEARLAQTVRALHAAHAPQAVAVVATPVVAINNDDIETTAVELREELGIPVFAVGCDGFRSRLAGTGTDVALQALLRHLVPLRPRERGGQVLLLASGSSAADVAAAGALLAELGLPWTALPQGLAVDTLEPVASARLAVALDGEDDGYAAALLQEGYGVPAIAPPPPVGRAASSRWLAAVGDATGHGAQARLLATRHEQRLAEAGAPLARFAGARVAVALPAAQAAAFDGLLAELGLRGAGFVLPSVSAGERAAVAALAQAGGERPVIVGEGQGFEETHLLRRLAPDLLVTRGQPAAHALALGIPVLDLQATPITGYDGVEAVARAIGRRLARPALAAFLGAGPAREHYTPGWLGRSPNWYIKQEAR